MVLLRLLRKVLLRLLRKQAFGLAGLRAVLLPILAIALNALVVWFIARLVRISNKALGRSAADVASKLRDHKLTNLDLAFHVFTEEEWCQIFNALKTNRSCTCLRLVGTCLTDERMVHLAEALIVNRYVMRLDVSDNLFGNEGAELLAGALQAQHRPGMEALHYSCTQMGEAGQASLREVNVNARSTGSIVRNSLGGYFPWQRPEASGQRFHFSNYKEAYDSFPDPPGDLYREVIEPLLADYASSGEAPDGFKADDLVRRLRASETLVQSRVGRDLTLPQQAVVIWTSDQKSGGKTFYSIVNAAIRADKKGAILNLSAHFCRALNCHLVLRNNPVALGEVELPEKVFRGTWMPEKQVRWFRERHGEDFRAVQLVATSDRRYVADNFLVTYDQSHLRHIPIRFEISMGSRPLHVRLLENLTSSQGEREWLFPAYSSFQVAERFDTNALSSRRAADPVIIKLNALADNQDVPELTRTATWI